MRPGATIRTGEIRLQWCHGAPGIVVDRGSDYLDEELSARRRGARRGWPEPTDDEKGAGICHGTAGNGYALLAAFERTGDEQWLDRARGASPCTRSPRSSASDRCYSLWTGAIGAAVFAADCLDGRCRYPFLG